MTQNNSMQSFKNGRTTIISTGPMVELAAELHMKNYSK